MQRHKDEIMDDFVGLAGALSPENLHSDGEASQEQVQKRLKSINTSWEKLEKEIGYTVTEEDAWRYSSEKRKTQSSQNKPNFFGKRI